jgi:hypothetical protein
MSETYLHHVSTRIVGMFELYAHNIDPDEPGFQNFIKSYVAAKDSRPPETIPYSHLYTLIQEAIRQYLHQASGKELRPKK